MLIDCWVLPRQGLKVLGLCLLQVEDQVDEQSGQGWAVRPHDLQGFDGGQLPVPTPELAQELEEGGQDVVSRELGIRQTGRDQEWCYIQVCPISGRVRKHLLSTERNGREWNGSSCPRRGFTNAKIIKDCCFFSTRAHLVLFSLPTVEIQKNLHFSYINSSLLLLLITIAPRRECFLR
jgi:hypothetical protein